MRAYEFIIVETEPKVLPIIPDNMPFGANQFKDPTGTFKGGGMSTPPTAQSSASKPSISPTNTPPNVLANKLKTHVDTVDQPVRNATNAAVDRAYSAGKFNSNNPPSVQNIMKTVRQDPELIKSYPNVGKDSSDHFGDTNAQKNIANTILQPKNWSKIANDPYRGFDHPEGASTMDNAVLTATHFDHPDLLPAQQEIYSRLINHPNPEVATHPATVNLGNRLAVNQSGYWQQPNAGADLKTIPKGIDPVTGELSTEVGTQGHRYLGSAGNHTPPEYPK
jgi:hypothetical protein